MMHLKNNFFFQFHLYQFPVQAHVTLLGLPVLVAAWIYTKTEVSKSYHFQEGGKALRLSASRPWVELKMWNKQHIVFSKQLLLFNKSLNKKINVTSALIR